MSSVLPCGLTIERNAQLASLTSWLVGGPADFMAQPKTVEELREAIAWGRLKGLPITFLGGGTNVLISDQGVRGLLIALRKLVGAKIEEVQAGEGGKRLLIECLAGTSKSELLKNFLKHRLEPALFLAGLPGDVGGGVVMNAGVGEMFRPREFVEITDWVEVLRWNESDEVLMEEDGSESQVAPTHEQIQTLAQEMEVVRLRASELHWSYRHCEGWRPGVIVRVGLSWPLEPKDDILPRVKQANQIRLTKQPLDMPSCGSVFVNPPGHKSGQLVEQAGLKGFTIGGAKVSEKHANFIVNTGSAKATDIHRVIEHVKATVLEKSGVSLRTEVVYLGDWGR